MLKLYMLLHFYFYSNVKMLRKRARQCLLFRFRLVACLQDQHMWVNTLLIHVTFLTQLRNCIILNGHRSHMVFRDNCGFSSIFDPQVATSTLEKASFLPMLSGPKICNHNLKTRDSLPTKS